MPRLLNGNGLAEWPSRGRDQPIVVRANEATARQLGLTLDQLLEVAATLEMWGTHADGSDVYRFRDLLASLGQLPDPVETASHRGGLVHRRRGQAKRGRPDGR